MKDKKKNRRRYSSSDSSNSSYDRKRKKEENSLHDRVKMLSEYRKIHEQKNQQQIQQQPYANPFYQSYQPINMPPKVTHQSQMVIQNPKFAANKSHKEYQPFYIPVNQEEPNPKQEKNEIKRSNLDSLIVFKKNYAEIIPPGVYSFQNLILDIDSISTPLLISIGRKYLESFEKVFKETKGFEKKRNQISKTLKGIMELQKRLKEQKKPYTSDENSAFDLFYELQNGLDLTLAEQFLDLKAYGVKLDNPTATFEETEKGKELFKQCLSLIE